MRRIQTNQSRPGRVVLRFAAATFLALVLAPGSANAHAAFEDASPEPGARVGSSPAQITIAFSEPLNYALSKARIVDARSGRSIVAGVSFGAGNRMVLRPARPLPTAAYQVRWHTVSIRDGHTLEGSFGLGVRTNAVDGAAQLEQSPLARGGLLRHRRRSGLIDLVFNGLDSPWAVEILRGVEEWGAVHETGITVSSVRHGSARPASCRTASSSSTSWIVSVPSAERFGVTGASTTSGTPSLSGR